MFFLAAAVMVQAQDCKSQLDEANRLYKKKDYQSTLTLCQTIMSRGACNESVGEDATRLIKLCEKRIEEEDFNKCTTVEACDEYLEKHPKGKYVAHVTQLRAALASAAATPVQEEKQEVVVQQTVQEKEDVVVKEKPSNVIAVTIVEEEVAEDEPANEVKDVKDVKGITVINDVKPEVKEEPAVVVKEEPAVVVKEEPKVVVVKEEPKPEAKEEPKVEVKESPKQVAVQVVKEEPAKPVQQQPVTPVVKEPKNINLVIKSIDFANADRNRNIINDYGFEMYASDIRYLIPRIVYEGLSQEWENMPLDCKIINPDGSVQKSSNSPEGYTYRMSLLVKTGQNASQLPAWGNDGGGVFVPGDYRLEVWYDGDLIFQKPFTVLERLNPLSRGNWRRALKECSVNVTSSCNTGSYKGQKEHSNRNGLGLFAWDDGSFYIGNWLDGDQKGMAIYAVPKGRAVMNCPQAAYYVGEWDDKVKTGKGKCYDKDGNALYNGTFAEDAPSQTYPMPGLDSYKLVCIEYDDGHYYVGETVNGKMHGQGMLIWENGNVWYGHFIYGERDGDGVELLYDGTVNGGVWEGDMKL